MILLKNIFQRFRPYQVWQYRGMEGKPPSRRFPLAPAVSSFRAEIVFRSPFLRKGSAMSAFGRRSHLNGCHRQPASLAQHIQSIKNDRNVTTYRYYSRFVVSDSFSTEPLTVRRNGPLDLPRQQGRPHWGRSVDRFICYCTECYK